MKPPKVAERKLRRLAARGETLYGLYHYMAETVDIEPRQTEAERLDTLLHELLHHIDHKLDLGMTEAQVRASGTMLKRVLWKQGYRRVKS